MGITEQRAGEACHAIVDDDEELGALLSLVNRLPDETLALLHEGDSNKMIVKFLRAEMTPVAGRWRMLAPVFDLAELAMGVTSCAPRVVNRWHAVCWAPLIPDGWRALPTVLYSHACGSPGPGARQGARQAGHSVGCPM